MGADTGTPDRDLHLGDRDFKRIAALVHDIAGIMLPENKRPLVQSRLMRRLRAIGLHDFGAYADYLSGADSDKERGELISAVTTNVTSFFREQHHFDTLRQRLVPDMILRARAGEKVRIWSAGCSTGEEPYSIAATVLSAFPDVTKYDVRILATDIDATVIARTREAHYATESTAGIAPEMARLMFEDARGGPTCRIKDAVRRLVTCNTLNLQEDWPIKCQYDAIFCRNVVIYFDKPTQERLWARFLSLLAPGASLMIGHSERVTGPALADLTADGVTTYWRRKAPRMANEKGSDRR